MLQTLRNLWYNYWTNYTRRLVKMSTLSPPASQGWLTGRVPSPLSTHTKTAGPLLMTGWYSSSWKARSLEYGEGGGFPPPFSYATKQSGGDKTHRPPDTAARLRPTKQPVCFTTERAVCDNMLQTINSFFFCMSVCMISFIQVGSIKFLPRTCQSLRPIYRCDKMSTNRNLWRDFLNFPYFTGFPAP